ncbi:MAG: hypothetical protein HYX68_06560 [Planctomycetes bacterium]|nr:hypothetical protein [Planctomycetota bacterium]
MEIIPLNHARQWPELAPLSSEQLKEAHALARAAFTAEDLQKFTEIDEGVPMEVFIHHLQQKQDEHNGRVAP